MTTSQLEIIQHSLDDFTDDFIFEVDDDILSEDDEDDDVEPILD